jgi:hypothetical protein
VAAQEFFAIFYPCVHCKNLVLRSWSRITSFARARAALKCVNFLTLHHRNQMKGGGAASFCIPNAVTVPQHWYKQIFRLE